MIERPKFIDDVRLFLQIIMEISHEPGVLEKTKPSDELAEKMQKLMPGYDNRNRVFAMASLIGVIVADYRENEKISKVKM